MIFIISEASSHYCGTCTTGSEITVSMRHTWEVERLWGLVHVNLSFCISVSLTLRGGKYCIRTLGACSSYQVTPKSHLSSLSLSTDRAGPYKSLCFSRWHKLNLITKGTKNTKGRKDCQPRFNCGAQWASLFNIQILWE